MRVSRMGGDMVGLYGLVYEEMIVVLMMGL